MKINPTKTVTTLIIIMLSILTISAKDYFVASDGSDSASGSKKSPWATIQKAAVSVSPGDNVFVREGKYNEMI